MIKNNHIVAQLPTDLCFFPSIRRQFAVPCRPEQTCLCFDCDPWAFWAAPLPTGAPCQSSGPSDRCLGSRPARNKWSLWLLCWSKMWGHIIFSILIGDANFIPADLFQYWEGKEWSKTILILWKSSETMWAKVETAHIHDSYSAF